MVLFAGIRFPLAKFGHHLLDFPLRDDLRAIIEVLTFGECKKIHSHQPDYHYFHNNKLMFRFSDLEELDIFGQLKRLEQPLSDKHQLNFRVVRNKDGIQFFVGHEYAIDGYFNLADLDQDKELQGVKARIRKAGFMDDLSNCTFYELM